MSRNLYQMQYRLCEYVASQYVEEAGDIEVNVDQLTSVILKTPKAACPTDCNIVETALGKYEVSYTAVSSGPHQLRVRVGDVDIPGSPALHNTGEKEGHSSSYHWKTEPSLRCCC